MHAGGVRPPVVERGDHRAAPAPRASRGARPRRRSRRDPAMPHMASPPRAMSRRWRASRTAPAPAGTGVSTRCRPARPISAQRSRGSASAAASASTRAPWSPVGTSQPVSPGATMPSRFAAWLDERRQPARRTPRARRWAAPPTARTAPADRTPSRARACCLRCRCTRTAPRSAGPRRQPARPLDRPARGCGARASAATTSAGRRPLLARRDSASSSPSWCFCIDSRPGITSTRAPSRDPEARRAPPRRSSSVGGRKRSRSRKLWITRIRSGAHAAERRPARRGCRAS